MIHFVPLFLQKDGYCEPLAVLPEPFTCKSLYTDAKVQSPANA